MKLRPHHALCIQNFTGHGYDQTFTWHMAEIVRRLREYPDTVVDIISGCDDLCARCPNRENGVCTTLDKVAEMDRAVLSSTGLRTGETVEWERLSALAKEKILETAGFESICKSCEWYELCRATGACLKNVSIPK